MGCPVPKVVKEVINNVGTAVRDDEMKDLMAKLKEAEKMIEVSKATIAALEAEKDTRIEKEE